MEKEQSTTVCFMLKPKHTEIIKKLALGLGDTSMSAALRYILEWWEEEHGDGKTA